MEEVKNENDSADIEQNKTMAAVGYVWVLCLLPLLLKKRSKFAQFHAKQGLLLFIIEVVGWLIPGIGWLLILLAGIYAMIGIVMALDGKYWKMPLLYQFVKKLNL